MRTWVSSTSFEGRRGKEFPAPGRGVPRDARHPVIEASQLATEWPCISPLTTAGPFREELAWVPTLLIQDFDVLCQRGRSNGWACIDHVRAINRGNLERAGSCQVTRTAMERVDAHLRRLLALGPEKGATRADYAHV